MRPARQGSLDGLCGVYAIINALEPCGVEAPRGARLYKDMFKQLTHGLGAVGVLAAMQDGLRAEELEAAATLAFGWLHATWGFELAVSRPLATARMRSAKTFTTALRGWLAKPETAAVISYERAHGAHWTVAREVTRTELLLRDSDGVGSLRLADFRRPGTSWRFRPADTLLISRQLRLAPRTPRDPRFEAAGSSTRPRPGRGERSVVPSPSSLFPLQASLEILQAS